MLESRCISRAAPCRTRRAPLRDAWRSPYRPLQRITARLLLAKQLRWGSCWGALYQAGVPWGAQSLRAALHQPRGRRGHRGSHGDALEHKGDIVALSHSKRSQGALSGTLPPPLVLLAVFVSLVALLALLVVLLMVLLVELLMALMLGMLLVRLLMELMLGLMEFMLAMLGIR